MPAYANGTPGTANDGTPVWYAEKIGRFVPSSQARMFGIDPKSAAPAAAAGGSPGGPVPQTGTMGLRPDAPGVRYLTTPVAGKDPSEAAYYRDLRKSQLDPAANSARDTIAADRRFEALLGKQETGGRYATPVVGDWFGLWDPEVQEIRALSNKAARHQRQPGEGTISDYDARMFQTMVPGMRNATSTNKNLILAERIAAENAQERRAFADWYHERFNTTSGWEGAWKNYVESNPIFDPSSESLGQPTLNAKRLSWRQYYGDVRGELDTRPSQTMRDIQRSQVKVPDTARTAWDRRVKQGLITGAGKWGDPNKPYLAPDEATLNRLPKGSYAISPDGVFGIIQ